MSDSWKEMERAKEEEYFNRQNKAAFERLATKKDEKRLSPITGEPMEQITIHGVVVDRCPKSGYIGLDAGELEELLKASKADSSKSNWMDSFVKGLIGGSK